MTTSLLAMTMQLPVESIESYIQKVNKIPMLTAEEEMDYANRWYYKSDREAAKALVLSHLRFVVKIARGYLGYGLGLADLIQEGNVGLMKAVKRFNPGVGVRLVSFAVHWVKAEIHEYIIRNWRIVKVATTKAQRKLFFNLRKAKKRLGWFSEEEVQGVASDLGVSAKEVREMESRLNAHDTAFDAPTEEDDSNMLAVAPIHYLEAHNADPAQHVEADNWEHLANDQLYEAIEQLDPREKEIVINRWLADGKMTLQALANKYNVSAERIRQIEKMAFDKIKAELTLV